LDSRRPLASKEAEMPYSLRKFVAAAWSACTVQGSAALRLAMIASALVVLTVPASAVTADLGTFTPEECTPACNVAISGGPDVQIRDNYLFNISDGALAFTANVGGSGTTLFAMTLFSGFPPGSPPAEIAFTIRPIFFGAPFTLS